MKFKTRVITDVVEKTINGKTHQVKQNRVEQVPVAPRDSDATVIKLAMRTVGVVIVGAIVWSTVAIGSLLSHAAPSWAAYTVAGVFDLAWVLCMAFEWLARFDADKAELPKRAGWGLLLVSMSAVFAHGFVLAGWVVGVVGALVSALAKGLWFVAMKHVAVEMDSATRQWVRAERAEIDGQRALLAVQREFNRSRQGMADERVALQAQMGAQGLSSGSAQGSLSPAQAQLSEPSPVGAYEPLSPPVEPVSLPEPTYPQAVSPQAKKAEAVARVSDMLTSNPGLTSGQVADTLGVSAATAKRYLQAARGPYA